MKIAMVVRNYHKGGGISRCAAELTEYFAHDNVVHVFTASWRDAEGIPVLFHKVPVLSFDFLKDRGLTAINNIFEMASFALFSFFMIRPGDYDIVHSDGSYIGGFDVFTTHSCHAESMEVSRAARAGLLGKLKKTVLNPLHLILLLIERCSVKRAGKIIAVSSKVKRDIIKHYNIPDSRIDVIANGVDLARFNPANELTYRSAVREKLGLEAADKVIIFPAHEFERKGLSTLMEALKVIHRKDLYVVVAGEDNQVPFREKAKKHGLEKNVIFAGRVTGIERYYAASDLFVFPAYYEPFGLVILEAMAAGLPVIASGFAGASELITDNGNGIIISDPSDFRAVAGAIRRVLADGKAARDMGERARISARSFPWENIAETTLNLYENALLDKSYETDFGRCVGSCLKMELKHERIMHGEASPGKYVRSPLEASDPME